MSKRCYYLDNFWEGENDYERIMKIINIKNYYFYFYFDLIKYLYSNFNTFTIDDNNSTYCEVVELRNKTLLNSEIFISELQYGVLEKIKNRKNQSSEEEFEGMVLLCCFSKYHVNKNLPHMIVDFKNYNVKYFFKLIESFNATKLTEHYFNGSQDSLYGGTIKYMVSIGSHINNRITLKDLEMYSTILTAKENLTTSKINMDKLLTSTIYNFPKAIKNSLVLIFTQKCITKKELNEMLSYR